MKLFSILLTKVLLVVLIDKIIRKIEKFEDNYTLGGYAKRDFNEIKEDIQLISKAIKNIK